MVHASASCPACPAKILAFLCQRIFPEEEFALRRDPAGTTPLVAAIRTASCPQHRRAAQNKNEKLAILLDWSTAAASQQVNGQYPLAHALKRPEISFSLIKRLKSAYPDAVYTSASNAVVCSETLPRDTSLPARHECDPPARKKRRRWQTE